MRRLISILLLAVFSLPLLLPVLATGQDADAGLPACCRRNGKHHCMMSMEQRGRLVASHGPQFESAAEKCPYCPGSVAPTHTNPLATPLLASAMLGGFLSHPNGLPQTEAKGRIARERSNGKRGPPSLTIL